MKEEQDETRREDVSRRGEVELAEKGSHVREGYHATSTGGDVCGLSELWRRYGVQYVLV
jgi:hypothetical protein